MDISCCKNFECKYNHKCLRFVIIPKKGALFVSKTGENKCNLFLEIPKNYMERTKKEIDIESYARKFTC